MSSFSLQGIIKTSFDSAPASFVSCAFASVASLDFGFFRSPLISNFRPRKLLQVVEMEFEGGENVGMSPFYGQTFQSTSIWLGE